MAESLNIIIIGAGGFGREVYQYLTDLLPSNPSWKIGGFLDQNPGATSSFAGTGTVLDSPENYDPQPSDRFVIAIGEPAIRLKVARNLEKKSIRYATIIHPTAYVSSTANIAEGAVICPFAFVAPHTKIGNHAILNTYASIGHDASIGNYSVLSPYAVINGNVSLADGVFMGTHATVIPGKKVGGWTKIGAGAVVSRNLEPGSLALGNPATARIMYKPPTEL